MDWKLQNGSHNTFGRSIGNGRNLYTTYSVHASISIQTKQSHAMECSKEECGVIFVLCCAGFFIIPVVELSKTGFFFASLQEVHLYISCSGQYKQQKYKRSYKLNRTSPFLTTDSPPHINNGVHTLGSIASSIPSLRRPLLFPSTIFLFFSFIFFSLWPSIHIQYSLALYSPTTRSASSRMDLPSTIWLDVGAGSFYPIDFYLCSTSMCENVYFEKVLVYFLAQFIRLMDRVLRYVLVCSMRLYAYVLLCVIFIVKA